MAARQEVKPSVKILAFKVISHFNGDDTYLLWNQWSQQRDIVTMAHV